MELAVKQLLDHHSMNANKETDRVRDIPDLMKTALNDADQESGNDRNFYDEDNDKYPVYSTSGNNENIKIIKQHSKGLLNGLGHWVQQ